MVSRRIRETILHNRSRTIVAQAFRAALRKLG